MPPHQACSRSGPATPIQISRGDTIHERYLEYAAHGGFNNQRRNLFHGLLMAHVLKRVLLLPPALSHRAAPHYGQCPSHVAPPSAILERFEKAALNAEKAASIKKPQDLPSASLRRLLNFTQVEDLVKVEDLGAVATSTIASALVKYDCTNTIWTFSPQSSCRARDGWRARGACKCRDVSKTLGAVAQPLLRIGSTFKGFDTDPIRSTVWGARLQRATLTYTDPMLAVARHASAKFAPNRNYVALHLRGGDGEFRRRFHQTVRNAFKELITSYLARRKKATAPEVLPVPLYVASDTSYRSSREFREGLARLAAVVRKESNGASGEAISVSYLRKVIPDAQKAVVAASKTPQDGRLLAHAPDLEMHLDLLICAHALLGFGGTAGSSVSSSIRTLRKYHLSDERAVVN
jgi:hypothetical protein